MKKKLLSVILATCMALNFTGCLDSTKGDNDSSASVSESSQELSSSEAATPRSAKDCKNTDYKKIVKEFEEAGFENIETEPLGDMVVGIVSTEDEVKKISINGKDNFKQGDVFKKDAEIVITYHSYPLEDYIDDFIDDLTKEEATTTKATTTKETTTTSEKTTTQKETTTKSGVSLEYKNALESAKSYLNFMAFSRQGLIEQLEYEQYSKAAATYAVDNCGADWNEQAVKSAKSYLELMPFSKQELIEQLEYEGFTAAQAKYGVDQVYK